MDPANASVRNSEIRVANPSKPPREAIPWLVIGMGSMAYGKERRAVTALKHMPRIHPYFLTTIWEDGTVSELLRLNGFNFTPVTIGYLGRARLRWTLINLWHMPKLFWEVLRIYRAQHCKGVLVLALLPLANVLPALLFLEFFLGARFVFYLGDIPARTRPNHVLCGIMNWMADAIIVNSEAVRRSMVSFGIAAEDVRLVYNGLALERFTRAVPFGWRKKFGWSDEVLLVGYAGQFAENKGVWDFLTAAEQILQHNDSCRFVFIGKIDNENACYQKLAKHVREQNLDEKIVFVGWISEMERAYAVLDVIVVPSRHEEPASNVIIEAMASGIPVIATRTGGSPELVQDGVTGFLVEQQRPEDIVEKIMLLMHDRALLKRLSVGARTHAHTCFDAKRNALEVEEALLTSMA
jgi:glycosyltransferase involved in cell wall biosynthesis